MTTSLRLTLLACALLLTDFTQSARAAILVETEADGSAANNSIGTAQLISESAFTIPTPAGAFNLPGFYTTTIQGRNGDNDVDFFRFTAAAGQVYIDVDNTPATFDPIVALFDAAGTLIAYGDDSELDPGSENTVDSFLGILTLPDPGFYYIGISRNANFPTTALTGTETALARPDSTFGGYAVSGVTAGVATYDFNDVQPAGGAPYTVHVSMSAVPEPATLSFVAVALLVLTGVRRRRQSM